MKLPVEHLTDLLDRCESVVHQLHHELAMLEEQQQFHKKLVELLNSNIENTSRSLRLIDSSLAELANSIDVLNRIISTEARA